MCLVTDCTNLIEGTTRCGSAGGINFLAWNPGCFIASFDGGLAVTRGGAAARLSCFVTKLKISLVVRPALLVLTMLLTSSTTCLVGVCLNASVVDMVAVDYRKYSILRQLQVDNTALGEM
jgi:hypothetical protein